MGETRFTVCRAVYRTWRARLLTGIPIAAGAYQFGCDQFGFPTLPDLWGMTGAALPWWAWILLAQTGAVYGLFEYVRSSAARVAFANAPAVPQAIPAEPPAEIPEPDITLHEVGQRVAKSMGPIPQGGRELTEFTRQVNLAIADKIGLKKLVLWGRFADFAREPFAQWELNNAIVDYVKNEVRIPNQWHVNTYTDIMLYREQVDQIWPDN